MYVGEIAARIVEAIAHTGGVAVTIVGGLAVAWFVARARYSGAVAAAFVTAVVLFALLSMQLLVSSPGGSVRYEPISGPTGFVQTVREFGATVALPAFGVTAVVFIVFSLRGLIPTCPPRIDPERK